MGADRIAANGDVANKIGTYNLAVLARHHGVKFMAVAPVSTIDMSLADGHAIPIEERPPEEVTRIQGVQIAPEGVKAMNPSFDVTPAELVDAIVTELDLSQRIEQVRTLQEAGYVAVTKTFQYRKPQTTYALTPAGQQAFARYIDLLEQIVRQTKTKK